MKKTEMESVLNKCALRIAKIVAVVERFSDNETSDATLYPCAYPEWQKKRLTNTHYHTAFTLAEAYPNLSVADRLVLIAAMFIVFFEEAKDDYRKLTELVAVLNHKIWEHYDNGDELFSRKYDILWRKGDSWASEHLEGDAMTHFCWVLD